MAPRRLFLLRHAKSSWDDPSLADFDRPLAARGEKAAVFMGQLMAAEGHVPDRAIVSTAARTRATLAGLLPAFSAEFEIHLTRAIYEAPAAAVIRTIAQHGGDAERLLVVGHNPGLEDAAAALALAEPSPDLEALKTHYPTGALAVFEFDLPTWRAIAPGTGRLVRFVRPRAAMGEGGQALN